MGGSRGGGGGGGQGVPPPPVKNHKLLYVFLKIVEQTPLNINEKSLIGT